MRRLRSVLLVVAAVSLAAACSSPDPMKGARDGVPLSQVQIASIVANPDRSEADRRNDVRRKPVDMLEFAGVRPGMSESDALKAYGVRHIDMPVTRSKVWQAIQDAEARKK